MTWNEVFCNTFEALSEELGLPPAGKSLVELCRADDADFCQEVVAKGWLSEAQMAHAAERYRLGKSKNGKPIFWMIDERGIVRDGRIGDTWVSMIFKRRYPECGRYIVAKHCLFGEHLISKRRATLGTDPSVQQSEKRKVKSEKCNPHCSTVAIVESERSAVVLSELFPECIWMAYSILIRILLVVLMSRSSNWLTRPEGFMISICRWWVSLRSMLLRSRKSGVLTSWTL